MKTLIECIRLCLLILVFTFLRATLAGAQSPLLAGTHGSPRAADIRLAIIVDEPSALAGADLLTAEFSHLEGIQLLERAQIEKVYREQGFSTANQDYLKLGEILGADALLVLSPLTESGSKSLQTRLVAVGPGVVVGSVRSPLPLKDEFQWAGWITLHFRPLLPKLTTQGRDAIPLSIINFRSPVSAPEERNLEEQLTLLTVERLSHEHKLFVLERQQMQLLNAEKELRGANASAFWSGSHLLEAVLDRDGYSKDTVTLNARLLPPKGAAPFDIEVRGSRTNPTEVVSRLSESVVEYLKLASESTTWNPSQEAARYVEEARWAFKWGMLREAQSACEAAWALGTQTKEIAELRIRIYAAEGTPPHNDSLSRNPESPDYAPDVRRLQPALHALDLYNQGFHSFLLRESMPSTNWYRLGWQLLSSELLRQFSYFPESCQGHELELANLRLLSRDTISLFERSQLYTNLSPSIAEMRAGAYWYDTPEACLQEYRKLASLSYLQAHHQQFIDHILIGWTAVDRARIPALWRSFVDEWCNSTNPVERVEGYFLSYEDSQPDQQIERATRLSQVALENMRALKEYWLGTTIESAKDASVIISAMDREKAFMEDLLNNHPSNGSMDLWSDVGRIFYQLKDRFKGSSITSMRKDRLRSLTVYLTTQLSTNMTLDPAEFEHLFGRGIPLYNTPLYEKPEAEALLPLLQDYQTQLKERAARSQPNARATLQKVDTLLSQLQITVSPPADATPRMAPTPPKPATPVTNPIPRAQAPCQIPALARVSTNAILVTRFWPWPQEVKKKAWADLFIGSACFRDGSFWIEALCKADSYYLQKAFLLKLEPGKSSIDTVELPLLNYQYKPSKTETKDDFETGDSFEVRGSELFFGLGDKIKRYSSTSMSWQDLPVPASGSLTVLKGRLFVANENTIAEISPDGSSQTLLASTRRRPPENILDSLEHFESRIFPGPNGAIATRIQDRLYAFDDQQRSWSEFTTLPRQPAPATNVSSDQGPVLSYSVVPWRTNQVFIPTDESSAALMLPQPATLRTNYSLRQAELEDPIWCFKGDPLGMRTYLWRNAAWVFFDRHSLDYLAPGPANPRSMFANARILLQAQWKDQGRLFGIPLEIDARGATMPFSPANLLVYAYNGNGHPRPRTYSTPVGLFFLDVRVGIWLLPWDDVQTALELARKERAAQQHARSAKVDALRANLCQKHHLSQVDNPTPEQKAAIIDDAAFLELKLDDIDVNHNGKLDANELAYFDVNRNSQLDPPEQAGIEVTQSLLAQMLFHEYDLNHDSQLDQAEYGRLVADTATQRSDGQGPRFGLNSGSAFNEVHPRQFDRNPNATLDIGELQAFAEQEFLQSLFPSGRYSSPISPKPSLKQLVESYWNPGMEGFRGQPPFISPRMGPPTFSGNPPTTGPAGAPTNGPPAKY